MGAIRNDFMHGGDGHDVFYPRFGDDEIWGDDGIDTVVLPGRRRLILSGFAGTKTIVDADRSFWCRANSEKASRQ